MEVGGGKLSSFFTPMSVQHQQLQQQQQKESTTKEKQLELNPILRQEVSYCV
jgi:hypothetical protein